MLSTKNEIMQAVTGLEKIAEQSNDISIVRGAYKLIRQIEEFVQQLPEEGKRNATQADSSTAPAGAARKGKPGRKKAGRPAGKMKLAKAVRTEGNEEITSGKKRGRPGRPKLESTNISESGGE